MQHGVTNKSTSSTSWTMGGIILLAVCILGSTVLLLVTRPDLSDRLAERVDRRWTGIAQSDAGSRIVTLRNTVEDHLPSANDYQRASAQLRTFLLAGDRLPLVIGGLGVGVIALISIGVVLSQRGHSTTRAMPEKPQPIDLDNAPRQEQAVVEPDSRSPLIEGRQDDIATRLAHLRVMNETRLIFEEPVQIHISPAMPTPPDPADNPAWGAETAPREQPILRPIQANRTNQHRS